MIITQHCMTIIFIGRAYGAPNEPKVIVRLHTKNMSLLGVMSGCDAMAQYCAFDVAVLRLDS